VYTGFIGLCTLSVTCSLCTTGGKHWVQSTLGVHFWTVKKAIGCPKPINHHPVWGLPLPCCWILWAWPRCNKVIWWSQSTHLLIFPLPPRISFTPSLIFFISDRGADLNSPAWFTHHMTPTDPQMRSYDINALRKLYLSYWSGAQHVLIRCDSDVVSSTCNNRLILRDHHSPLLW
jgi:hypothetical protein